MLVVDRVHKSFGKHAAVRGVSFDLPRGQVVGLLGPNGAGKTTTIRMITGFLPPDQGRVLVDGHDTLDDSAAARRSIGYLPESAPLYPEMSVRGYLEYRGRLFAMPRRARKVAVDRALTRCWLSEVADRRIGHLSKGYKQRVGLASALLHDPPVVILDEPSNGLDPTQISETRRLIAELGQTHTLLISSHILPEVERTCTRVVIIIRGVVRADGTPSDLIARGTGPARITLEVRTADDSLLRGTLGSIPGLSFGSAVPTADGWSSVTLLQQSGTDAREAVAASCAAKGIPLRALARERSTLEGVFLSLLESGEAREASA